MSRKKSGGKAHGRSNKPKRGQQKNAQQQPKRQDTSQARETKPDREPPLERVNPVHAPARSFGSHGVPARYKLVITLKSDLCAATGEGFASTIDADVSIDAHGRPFIPARRIKGCLRQASRDVRIGDKERAYEDLLFGQPGSQMGGLLSISDAVITIPDGLTLPSDSRQAIDLFTIIRPQVKLDPTTGTAEGEMLRNIRVVKHYLWAQPPRKAGHWEETTFEARVEVDSFVSPQSNGQTLKDEDIRSYLLNTVVPSLRNIGLGRNRGFGAVRCSLVKLVEQPGRKAILNSVEFEGANGKTAAISYVVSLDSPIMLPQENGVRSMGYIPGTSVQGFFASRLAGRDGLDLTKLLFSDAVRFSPLYPLDSEGNRCLPAPPFVVKMKAGDYDGLYASAIDAADLKENGTPKPLKDGFVSPVDWMPRNVKTEMVYHHSTGQSTNDNPTLYTQQCLSAGQVFGGFIECDPQYQEVLRKVLGEGVLRFGRSKSAQYARCTTLDCDKDYSYRSKGTMQLEGGAHYGLLLESDVALIDPSTAAYTTSFDHLYASLMESSGLKRDDINLLPMATNLSYHTVGGFNAKWNQKKPHIRVFSAGSCVAFTAEKSTWVESVFTVGERLGEGFGRVVVVDLQNAKPLSFEEQQKRKQAQKSACVSKPSQYEEQRSKAISLASRVDFSRLTPSFVGRVSLMARQATSWTDFCERVDGVRDDNKKAAIKSLCQEVEREFGEMDWDMRQQCLALIFRWAKYQKKLDASRGDV